jgi:ankyrin repeat protein
VPLQGNSRTLLHAAAQHGKTHLVQLLVSSVNAKSVPRGETALHLACAFNQAAYAEALLDSGADINSGSGTGATAALTAAMHGSTECLQLLAQRSADFSIRDNAGHTPLHAAATWGRLQCVSLLLSCTADTVADVNATSVNGSTPLILCFRVGIPTGLTQAAEAYTEFEQADADKCAQLLLDNGATVAQAALTELCARADYDIAVGDDDQHVATMRALSDYMTRLRSSVAAHKAVIAVHTGACSTSSTQQHSGTAVYIDSVTDSTDSSSGGSCSSSAANSAVQQYSSVTVQLVHAITGVKAAKLYKLELHTLEQLLAVHSSVSQTSSVLLNLLRPPMGWSSQEQQQQQQQCNTIELRYDGEYT